MNIRLIKNSIAVILIVMMTSCEEVIEIDLNSSNPVLIAEGVIDNESPAWVRLSYTSDYFDTEKGAVESGASVTISDDAGHSETLTYTSDGIYQGKDLIGSLDHQYTLSINHGDVSYTASSKLYSPSEIISVSFDENANQKPGQDKTYGVTVNFKDAIQMDNYYMFKFLINKESENNSYYLVDDEFYENTGEIEYSPFHLDFELGDSVLINLYSIDEETYVYYSELSDSEGGMMGASSTPYTPKSNFGSDVLGYFVAWTKVEQQTIVE